MKRNLSFLILFLLFLSLGRARCQAQTLEEVLGYGLPVVVVNTVNGEEPTSEAIHHPDGPYIGTTLTNIVPKEARMQIYRGDTIWYDSGDFVNDKSGIKIRHRGNTSATSSENKPFKLKLQKKADLIETLKEEGDTIDRASKDWVLLNYVNTVELPVANWLSRLVGMEYTPRMQFVNVIINDDYRGMYVLSESISREKECRIIVDKKDGYIIELDPYFWNEYFSIESRLNNVMQWTFKFPELGNLIEEQIDEIRSGIQQFEESISSNNYTNVIDVKSFAKWILVHDIMGTRDPGGCNIYIARTDREPSSLMRMPVVWDMASSSMQVANEWSRTHTEQGLFFSRLFSNEQCMKFTKAYIDEWARLKEENAFDSLVELIDGYASTPEGRGVKTSAPHHKQRWNYPHQGLVNLETKMSAAKKWMNDRKQWLDEQIAVMNDLPEGTFVLNGAERPQTGSTLSLTSSKLDLSQFTFKWTRGDVLGNFNEANVLSADSTYIITDNDNEHWLRAAAYDKSGKAIYSKDTWISKLPVLYIDTDDSKPITSKENYVTASLRIQGNAEFEQQYLGATEIRGRGTTSWEQYPQKPYKLKLDKRTNLFDFGKSKHWVLVSNFNDKSCLRNYLASELAKLLGTIGMNMTWVEVVLNGEVKGCYMLSQHIRAERNSVDIFDWEGEAEDVADALFPAIKETEALEDADKKLLEKAMTSNLAWVTDGIVNFKGKTYRLADYGLDNQYDITQGFLFEATAKKDGMSQFTTPGNVHFEVSAPEYLSTNSEMFSYATQLWNDFEAEYSRVPTADSPKNFSKYADVKSMVAIWFVNEFLGQGDPTNSRYSYIASDGKLHFGPAWDFDHAAACWTADPNVNFFYTFIHKLNYTYYKKWFPDPVLCQMTYDTYWEKARPFVLDFIAEGGEMNARYALFAEAGRTNDTLWGSYPSILKPTAEPRTTAEDVEALRTFLSRHIKWLDKQFVSEKKLIEAMNAACPYPCDPDIIDGIQSSEIAPGGTPQQVRKVIKEGHLYIIRGNKTYTIDGKRIK